MPSSLKTVSHFKLQKPEFKSAGLQAFKTSLHRGDELGDEYIRIFCQRVSLVAISSTCYQNTKAIELMSQEAILAPMEQVMAEVP